jgi:DNA replication protein DnaC
MRFFAGPRLLVIDELGYLNVAEEAVAALFQVITQRHLKGSIMLTTNLGVASWASRLGDPMVTAAMLGGWCLSRGGTPGRCGAAGE